MADIKVSIIVPVFNMQEYLSTCIESIIGQTLKEIEVILIDDGSTDGSLDICKQYARKDKRIKVITQVNSGVSSARNKGLEIAKGEYIGFVDADDWIEKEMYESMYKQAEEINAEIVICNYVEDTITNKGMQHNIEKDVLELQQDKEEYIASLLAGSDLVGTGCRNFFRRVTIYLYKRLLIETINNRFNNEIPIGEDFIFNIKILSKANKIGINRGKYYCYCINELSATQRYRANLEYEHEMLISEIEQVLDENGYKEIMEDKLVIMELTYLIKNVVNESHSDNHKRVIDKVKNIRQMCSNPRMQEMMKKYSIGELTLYRKLWFLLYRMKCGILLYAYYHYIAN